MLTWVIIGLAVIASGIGLFMIDDENDDIDAGTTILAASVAVLAGALIYTMAMDDYQVRQRVLGEEADRRGNEHHDEPGGAP